MNDSGEKNAIPWHIYLIYLCLISLILTGISFSRFTSVINNTGPENAAVPDVQFSSWIMDHQAEAVNLKGLKPGVSRAITIWVKNNEAGQVSGYNQSFTLELETTGNLPLQYTLTKDGSPVSLIHPDSYSYISAAQEFTKDVAETKSYILTINWPDSAVKKKSYYKDEIDYLQLRLRAVQL